MSSIEVRVREGFLPRDGSTGLHSFQEKIGSPEKWDSDTLLLEAPTGSGKTWGFAQITSRGGLGDTVLVVTPTVRLAEQTVDDLQKEDIEVASLDAGTVWSEYEEDNMAPKSTAKALFARNDAVVVNPAFLNYLLHGRYGDRGNIVNFLRESVNTVIYDEWHSYNPEQTASLLSTLLVLGVKESGVKSILASATQPEDAQTILDDVGIPHHLEQVRLQKQESKNTRKVRGELSLRIEENTCLTWVKENIESLREDGEGWILIFDELSNLLKASDVLHKNGLGEEVKELSRFSLDEGELKEYDWGDRIVLATNLLELGVNPPTVKDGSIGYNRMVTDPGISWKNSIQRIGRMSRKGTDSKVYLCLEKIDGENFATKRSLEKLRETGEMEYGDLLNWLRSSHRSNFDSAPSPMKTGAYLGVAFKDVGVKGQKESVRHKIKEMNEGEVVKGFKLFEMADATINELERKKQSSLSERVSDWWRYYVSTFSEFIPSTPSREVMDRTRPIENRQTKYDSIWLERNGVFDGDELVDVRDDPDNSFNVEVEGLLGGRWGKIDGDMRYGESTIPFETYKYEAKEKILEDFDIEVVSEMESGPESVLGSGSDDEIDWGKKLKDSVRPFLSVTASRHRFKVIDVYEGGFLL